MLTLALTSRGVDNAIFRVANALQVPVLLLALAALAAVLFELGMFLVELRSRSGRKRDLARTAFAVRKALIAGDFAAVSHLAAPAAMSGSMARALSLIVSHAREPGGEHRVNKALADFDYGSQQRLARTRLLVRAGPALGLMGTLIPLSPALTGLAQGNISRLSENLRVAFSVTVLGLLVGAVAYGLSLYRDRMYSQDLSDLEYIAAVIGDPRDLPEPPPPPAPAVPETPPPETTATQPEAAVPAPGPQPTPLPEGGQP
jgi:biopolymer transport protein ExbB/TolQ